MTVAVAAWVDGAPITAAEVDERVERLRRRDLASALPFADSREGRQLRRWVTQVAVVERLCRAEIEARPTPPSGPNAAFGSTITGAEAAALGSIVAAAWAAEPAVAAAAARVTADLALSPEERHRAQRLATGSAGMPVWSVAELTASARIEAFSRWLAAATHTRVRLEAGYEHPGDSAQPDNVHQH